MLYLALFWSVEDISTFQRLPAFSGVRTGRGQVDLAITHELWLSRASSVQILRYKKSIVTTCYSVSICSYVLGKYSTAQNFKSDMARRPKLTSCGWVARNFYHVVGQRER